MNSVFFIIFVARKNGNNNKIKCCNNKINCATSGTKKRMAKVSRKLFAEICGVKPNYLNNYIGRKKVHVGNDNLIDDSLPMNAEFKSNRVRKKEEPKKEKFEPLPLTAEELKLKKQQSEIEAQAATKKYNLEQQLKELAIEKAEQEVELNKIKIAKAQGEVIPTDLVKVVFAQHSKSITVSFHQGADNFISQIAKRTGMKREEMASLRGELIKVVNQSVKDSIKESKVAIKNIVSEYSEKRGVGERK